MENEDELQSSVLPQQIDGDPLVVFRSLDDVGPIFGSVSTRVDIAHYGQPRRRLTYEGLLQLGRLNRVMSIETKDSSATHFVETEIDGIIDYAIANQGIAESQLDSSTEMEIDGIIDNLASANQRIAENQLETDQLKIETREMLATLKSRLN
jgi:hypothetical protein